MKQEQIVHNLVILDESGSMDSIKEHVIKSFNEIVSTMKHLEGEYPEQRHFISMVSFNGGGIRQMHWKDEVASIKQINAKNYNPNFSTPLFDAMGFSITELKRELAEATGKVNVLVTIFTDGEENASREFNGAQIKALVDELGPMGWTFTYIGTDHDVYSVSMELNIHNVMSFDKSEAGIDQMLAKEKRARMKYSSDLSHNIQEADSYYEEPPAEPKKK